MNKSKREIAARVLAAILDNIGESTLGGFIQHNSVRRHENHVRFTYEPNAGKEIEGLRVHLSISIPRKKGLEDD